MKKIFLAILVLASFSSYSQNKKDYSFSYNTDSILTNGLRSYYNEKYDDAVKEYQKISKYDDKYLTAQYEIGLALSAAGKKEELRKHFEDLYNNGSMKEKPIMYTSYGSFLSDEKEYDKAEKIFEEGAIYMSNSSNFLYNQGILYLRKGDLQKSIDILKKVVTINPNLTSGHYFLGSLALENGNVTEGTLALLSYLILNPTGRYASETITKLNKKYGENYITKGDLKFSESGDDFSEIETILSNQLPLRKAYKVKSSFDDVIIRQMQAVMEYTKEHKMQDGFFETTYIPWIKDLMSKNHFEAYSYYILLSLEEDLGKKLTTHKKKITAFYESYIIKDLWNVYAKRNVNHFGKKQDVITFIEDGRPYLVGNVINGKKQGKFALLNDNGNIIGELNLENDELHGKQIYFDEKGNIDLERNFKNGKLDGEVKEFENGKLSTVENYKDGKLHGLSTTFYGNGSKRCELNFTEGERNGTLTCYYADGTKSSEVVYNNGKLDGKYVIYNEVGDITYTANYKNDLLEGNYQQFFDGKVLKAEATYKNGKVEGNYKEYYTNSKLNSESFYTAGKITKTINYHITGEKSSELIFDAKEQLTSYSYFSIRGEKYFEEIYKGNELKSGLQYTKNAAKPKEVSLQKKPFQIANLDGNVIVSGNYDKGKKNGEWNYYFSNGYVRIKENNIADLQQGLSYNYNRTGELNSISNYKDDKINGLYEVYDNGILSNIYYYSNGTQNGPFTAYYPNGKVKVEGFYKNGELHNSRITYRQNGQISQKTKYNEGDAVLNESFDINNHKDYEIDYINKNGKITITNNKTTTSEFSIVNGNFNGKYTSKENTGTPIVDMEFKNGVRHNSYKYYSPYGTIQYERNYYNGKLHGIDKIYDLVGNLRLIDEFTFGENNGKTVRFFKSGKKMYEYTSFDGSNEGDYIYYNQEGTPILKVVYENNMAIQYSNLNSEGVFGTPIEIVNETAIIESKYPNGKLAIKFQIEKGNITGKLIVQNKEGNPEYEANYKNGILEGNRIEYYSNGKIYKRENFKNSDYFGEQNYFDEEGRPWITATFENDELHGDFLIYKNGKLLVTKKYDSDELVKIIQ
jgi:uncharacterized protein